jgi:hypothetical protein
MAIFCIVPLLHSVSDTHTHTHTHNLPLCLVPPSYCKCNLLSTYAGVVDVTMLLQCTRTTNVGKAIRLYMVLWRKLAWKKCHGKNEECLKQCDTHWHAVTILVLPKAAVTWRGPVQPTASRSPWPSHCHQQQSRTLAGGCAKRISPTEVKEKLADHLNIGRYRPAPTLRNNLPPLYEL